MIGAILSLLVAAPATGAPVARFDCQVQEVQGERSAYREIIVLRGWGREKGVSIERRFDTYKVKDVMDKADTELLNLPGRFVVRIMDGSLFVTLERIADGSGRFSYSSMAQKPHHASSYSGSCTSKIFQAPPRPVAKGKKR